jgi:hypothetical protein
MPIDYFGLPQPQPPLLSFPLERDGARPASLVPCPSSTVTSSVEVTGGSPHSCAEADTNAKQLAAKMNHLYISTSKRFVVFGTCQQVTRPSLFLKEKNRSQLSQNYKLTTKQYQILKICIIINNESYLVSVRLCCKNRNVCKTLKIYHRAHREKKENCAFRASVTSVCSAVKHSFLIACEKLINATTPIGNTLMQKPFYKKHEAPNFGSPAVQKAYIEEIGTNRELMQKELSVNQEEQNLLGKRIQMMKEFINDLPASDPQYSMLAVQIQMDQIELDELKTRETIVSQRISEIQ